MLMGLVLSAVLTFGVGTAQAAKKRQSIEIAAANKATFMLMPELPNDNLGGNQLGYFNLRVKKDQTRTVRIKVFNPTKHTIKIYGQVKDATTNDNASVDYLGSNSNDRQLLKQPGSQFVTVPKMTTLAAGATKYIPVKVEIGNNFNGVKATAVNLSANQFNQKSAIKNAYRYAIGLILNGEGLKKRDYHYLQSPSIKTRFTKAKKAAISVELVNPDAMYLEKATINVKLQNQKWHFVQYEQSIKDGKIAPNTRFYVDLLLGGKRLVPGTYDMTLTTRNRRYNKTLHKQVLITESQAKYINRLNAAYLRNRNLILGSLVIVLVLLVGISLRIYYIRKRKKD